MEFLAWILEYTTVQLFVVHGRRFALEGFADGGRAELPASVYPASSFSALLSDEP